MRNQTSRLDSLRRIGYRVDIEYSVFYRTHKDEFLLRNHCVTDCDAKWSNFFITEYQ